MFSASLIGDTFCAVLQILRMCWETGVIQWLWTLSVEVFKESDLRFVIGLGLLGGLWSMSLLMTICKEDLHFLGKNLHPLSQCSDPTGEDNLVWMEHWPCFVQEAGLQQLLPAWRVLAFGLFSFSLRGVCTTQPPSAVMGLPCWYRQQLNQRGK